MPERQWNTQAFSQRADLQAHGFVLFQKLGDSIHGPIRLDSGAQHIGPDARLVKSTEMIKMPPPPAVADAGGGSAPAALHEQQLRR